VGRGAGAGQADAVEIPMGATGQAVLATATAAAARAAIVADDSQTTINNAAAKATPVDTDQVIIADNAAAGVIKKVTWANVKAFLKTYFDTIYPLKAGGIFTGSVTAVQNFISSTAALVLATTGAGVVYLRPNGSGSAVGQTTVNSAGDMSVNGDVVSAGAVDGIDIKVNGVSIPRIRAWVNFNGTGVIAVRGSFNVSSVIDNGQGDYTINFATPMPNANYAAVYMTGTSVGNDSGAAMINSQLAGSLRILTWDDDGNQNDNATVCVAIIQ
jgi:hypothetical protein